jgi:PASTA domain
MVTRGSGESAEAALGRRIKRAAGTIALASLLALAVCASTASAAPLSMTFTEARANVGASQLSDAALFGPPDTAPLEAQIGPGGESITAGVLDVPQFNTHITSPIDADVTVDFDYPAITGSFVLGAGELTLSGAVGATLSATVESGEKECIVTTTPEVLTLSTSTAASAHGSPRSGAPFTHGLTGAGSIGGEWKDMQASPVDPEPGGDKFFCEDVEKAIEGPGGIWLEQAGDVVPPSAPQLTSTDPASSAFSGTPRIRGAAEAGSTVRVYAGAGCTGTPVATGSAAELGSPGIRVEVPTSTTATFSATATDAAANTSSCSAPISYTRLHGDPPPSVRCVVPKLAGKKLARAKAVLRDANCAVGVVTKPRARKGKKLGQLVVKSTTPSAGTILADGGKVSLTLGPKPRKAHH